MENYISKEICVNQLLSSLIISLPQSIDFRLRKMEESSEQILSTLAVIHRFMSMHMPDGGDLRASHMNIAVDLPRVRTVSMSDNEAPMPPPNLQVSSGYKLSTGKYFQREAQK